MAISVCLWQSKDKTALEADIIKSPSKKAVKTTGEYKTTDPLTKHFSHTCFIYALYYIRHQPNIWSHIYTTTLICSDGKNSRKDGQRL